MSLFNLLSNAAEGLTQATLGTAKLVISPITQLTDLTSDKSHAEKAVDTINRGLDKIGSDK